MYLVMEEVILGTLCTCEWRKWCRVHYSMYLYLEMVVLGTMYLYLCMNEAV